ncbi:MAG: HIT family hydrolase [Clostridia bacterium]|nr:HIT family hydrolase [Clostridia bacterium]
MEDINFAGNSNKMTDFLGKEWKYDCLGCAMGEKKVIPPGGMIYENEIVNLAQDPEIPIKGFFIVSVKRHVNSIIDLTKEERYEVIELVNMAIKTIKDLGLTNEVTIVQEERSKHLHIWIFPHYEWMSEKFGKGITYLRDISSYAQENTTKEERDEIIDVVQKAKEYFKNYKFEL